MLTAENQELTEKFNEVEGRLKKLTSTVIPKLEDLESLQKEVLEELENIKEDANWLPKKFREKFKSTGTVVNAPVGGVDIPATIYGLIGMDTPWYFHGHDLTPLLKNPDLKWNKPAVVVHTAKQF